MLLCSCETVDGIGVGTGALVALDFFVDLDLDSLGGFGSAGGFGALGGFFGAAAFDRGFAFDLVAGTTAGDIICGGFVISLSEALNTL